MEISEQREGHVVVLSPAGRLNTDTSLEFQTTLLERISTPQAAVLVDLSRVEYISSAGLRALMMASRQCGSSNARVAVAGLTPRVKEIFTITRFFYVVTVFDTVSQALTALC